MDSAIQLLNSWGQNFKKMEQVNHPQNVFVLEPIDQSI